MAFWFFHKKKKEKNNDVDEIRTNFSSLSEEMKKIADWILHLHSRDVGHENDMQKIHERLSSLEGDMGEIKNFVSFFTPKMFKQLSKQEQTAVYKQTGVQTPVYDVQTSVQTLVQTSFLRNLTVMERAVVWVLLNTDLKLSCEDISVVLGKDRNTIRGQINSIKQKSEGLLEEAAEKSGKKRYYIEEKVKEMLWKGIKVGKRLKKGKSEGSSED